MPMHLHESRTSPVAAREERSLLRELGLPVAIGPADFSEHYAHDGCAALFAGGMQRHGLAFAERYDVPRVTARIDGLEELGRVELSWAVARAHDVVLRLAGGELALLVSHGGKCEVLVAARSADAAHRAARELGERLRSEPPPADTVPVDFWTGGSCGSNVNRRETQAPPWPDVAGNYPAPVRRALDGLVAATTPGAGALLLWHGPPGTGKTHALRALVRSWRNWCSAHYVTDPENFLAGTGYLMDVATAHRAEGDAPWRLIVLEDAGELMSVTARSEAGQGLSRVLNLTDGMLGQGVRCILLVTTNEPLGRLHPAVHRPGRCWASVDFVPFDPCEATAWLAARGVARDMQVPATLAELYAIAEGREPEVATRAGFGFARAAAEPAPRS